MRVVGLGFLCNNACVFCAQGDLRAQGAAGVATQVDAALAAIEPGETIAFVGGEPTLHEALPGWIAAAAARGAARVLVQTNGRRLAYRSYAQALAASSDALALDVSLHGSTEAMHDYHTGTPGSFQQTVRGLLQARAARVPVGVTTVVTRSSFRHLVDVVRLAHASGATAVNLAIAQPAGRAARARDRVLPPAELARPHLAAAVAEARKLGLGVIAGDHTDDPGLRDRFAGTGTVEHEAPAGAARDATGDAPGLVSRERMIARVRSDEAQQQQQQQQRRL